MKIIELIKNKNENIENARPVTIAFLGDSVTQGCFECYLKGENRDIVETIFDSKSSYSERVKEILNRLYPRAQVNIINSGISGDNAVNGYKRLERDILTYKPDLCVVSFGLNDSIYVPIEEYSNALNNIFKRLKEENIEVIFLTQNFMATGVSPWLNGEIFENLAKVFAGNSQNNGVLKSFMEEAKRRAAENDAYICDIYPMWEKLYENGVDTNELLANKLNHPIREIHYYMAIKLIETMFNN